MKFIQETTTKEKYGMPQRHALYECPICERHFETTIHNAQSGRKKNCGCAGRIQFVMPSVINGLKVIEDLGNVLDNSGRGRRTAVFQCNFCSNSFQKIVTDVKSKHGILHCGCQKQIRKPACNAIKNKPLKPIVKTIIEQCAEELGISLDEAKLLKYTYKGMKARCYTDSHHKYHRYGARGIIICDRWLESFRNFYMDMGAKPSSDLSIDRIDNDGNYEPSNCRWATDKEQQNNKSI